MATDKKGFDFGAFLIQLGLALGMIAIFFLVMKHVFSPAEFNHVSPKTLTLPDRLSKEDFKIFCDAKHGIVTRNPSTGNESCRVD